MVPTGKQAPINEKVVTILMIILINALAIIIIIIRKNIKQPHFDRVCTIRYYVAMSYFGLANILMSNK